MDLDYEELKTKTKALITQYSQDLAEDLVDKIMHIKSIYYTIFNSEKTSLKLLNYILETNFEALFENFCTTINLFCTTNCFSD